jgi:iron(III) transport system permease protein
MFKSANFSIIQKSGRQFWTLSVVLIALLVSVPILAVVSSVLTDSGQVWQHLVDTVLADYLLTSFWLLLGVGAGVLGIGVGTAWLVTMCQFPGRRGFEWALLLPLAAPAYLLAYTYTSMLDYFGPVQTFLRMVFGWDEVGDYWFPNVRSLPGGIVMLILVLYPYVYLLARVGFLEQSVCTTEASRSLGCNPWKSFFTVALPLARPSIVAGLALALMETLNDFGTVQYFGINAFTTGIYNTWFGMGDRITASQLSTVLMGFIFVLVILEQFSRRQARYYEMTNRYQSAARYRLGVVGIVLAVFACFLPIFLGFIAPSLYLLYLVVNHARETLNNDFLTLSANSLLLAMVSAAIALFIALILAYGERLNPNQLLKSSVRFAAMGYAIPGIVIAVGILIPIGRLDNLLAEWIKGVLGVEIPLLLSGTIAALIFAYIVRFLAVAFGTVESSLGKIRPSLDDASRSLGYGSIATLTQVHIPLMSGGLLTAAMLVFVDVMKELPATLVLRPFNYDTLAVRVYQYASDERLVEAAAPALAIVLVGLIPVIFLSWQISRRAIDS